MPYREQWQLTPTQSAVARRFIPAVDYYDADNPNPFVASVISHLPYDVASIKFGPEVASNMNMRRIFRHRRMAIFLDLDLGSQGKSMKGPLENTVLGNWHPRYLTVSPDKGVVGLKKAVASVRDNVAGAYNMDLVVRSAPSNMTSEACRAKYGKDSYEIAERCARLAVASDIRIVMCAGPEIEAVKSVDSSLQTIVTGCRLPSEQPDGHEVSRIWTPRQIFDAGGDYIATGHRIVQAALDESLGVAKETFIAYLDDAAQAKCFLPSAA